LFAHYFLYLSTKLQMILFVIYSLETHYA
jgi:hypothetical protein